MAAKSTQLQIRVTPAQKTALRRLARDAGLDVSAYVLGRTLPDACARFHEAVAALGQAGDARFALAALNDLLTELAPAEFREAVAHADLRGLSPLTRNYVAAMVEQAAARRREPPPAWTREIEPLDEPHFAVPFPRLRPYLLRAAPVAFKRRNLFVDATVGDRV